MHATLPWTISPEFEDALALATQRHLAQPATAPSTPRPAACFLDLAIPATDCETRPLSPSPVPRSASLRMKTRVAVRNKNPHRFQVVPLRDAATENGEKGGARQAQGSKQQPAPWTRQLALLRPSGVGLGISVPTQRPAAPETPERGRERERTRGDVFGGERRGNGGLLRGLQGLSPKRPGSPDRKENRAPRSPTKRAHRRREYTFDPEYTFDVKPGDSPASGDGDTTICAHVDIHASATQTTMQQPAAIISDDITITLAALHHLSAEPPARRPASRHFKSPSLGAITHLLSGPAPVPVLPAPTSNDDADDTPRAAVRCRKRTNTLSAGTKRYGVYSDGASPPARAPEFGTAPLPTCEGRVVSTYSLGALLATYAYSHDSLPSLYSQDSFVEGLGGGPATRPLRVHPRAMRVRAKEVVVHPHEIVVELMQEVDVAIGEWL
ncbi:hypothetical protein B0H15DRAFT_945933 [Mycena belliarum]|uniref:Uncharacterized protein n=1 Tax=Mycena belliarum TaxID=1033014 RepID=A0AAD6XYL2_9AGAR|nr:hypothetical protein B0H15DRAFT_945933 [Mycena belliae]